MVNSVFVVSITVRVSANAYCGKAHLLLLLLHQLLISLSSLSTSEIPRMLRACERTLAMAAHPLRLAIVGDVVSISLYKPRLLLLAILFRSCTKRIKSKETIAINSLLLYCLLRAFASLVLLSRNPGHRYPRLSAGV